METVKYQNIRVDGRHMPTQLDLFKESESSMKPLVYPNDFVNKMIIGDCLEIMQKIPDHCVDMVLCKLPYIKTKSIWDSSIPLDVLWMQYKRLIKPNGVIILISDGKFSAMLMMSSTVKYQYSAVWCELTKSKLFHNRLVSAHEDILLFYDNQPIYNPQYQNGFSSPPSTVIHLTNDSNGYSADKDLFSYLITTFSNEKMLILDNASHLGNTALACRDLNRDFICIEENPKLYEKSVQNFMLTY